MRLCLDPLLPFKSLLMCCIPDIISADLAKNVSPCLPSRTLIPFKSYRHRVSASRPRWSTLIPSSRVFVWSRVAPDKNICKHERQRGCLLSKAAAKQKCCVYWLSSIFSTKPQLMHSIRKETFSQIRAATTCPAAALVPGVTFVLVWQEVLLEMMEYPDRSHHLSSQLSDESSPFSALRGNAAVWMLLWICDRCSLSLNLTCLVWFPDKSWSWFLRRYPHWKPWSGSLCS